MSTDPGILQTKTVSRDRRHVVRIEFWEHTLILSSLNIDRQSNVQVYSGTSGWNRRDHCESENLHSRKRKFISRVYRIVVCSDSRKGSFYSRRRKKCCPLSLHHSILLSFYSWNFIRFWRFITCHWRRTKEKCWNSIQNRNAVLLKIIMKGRDKKQLDCCPSTSFLYLWGWVTSRIWI